MTSRFVNPKRKQTRLRPAHLAIAGLAALIAAGDHAGATDRRSERSLESIESRTASEPIMAIVSLHNQRITVYDANGWILRAPVSSGQKGRETPAGIFGVIQKEAEHYSALWANAVAEKPIAARTRKTLIVISPSTSVRVRLELCPL